MRDKSLSKYNPPFPHPLRFPILLGNVRAIQEVAALGHDLDGVGVTSPIRAVELPARHTRWTLKPFALICHCRVERRNRVAGEIHEATESIDCGNGYNLLLVWSLRKGYLHGLDDLRCHVVDGAVDLHPVGNFCRAHDGVLGAELDFDNSGVVPDTLLTIV